MISGAVNDSPLSFIVQAMINKGTKRKIELLSPAGDLECFLSAIRAGADAVYVGGNMFSARAYAKNLDNDELITAIDHAHLHGRKLYLTVNTILKNKEISSLYDYIKPLYEEGLDGVIVQDPGVIKILSGSFPGLPLHGSTQMAVTDAEGVMALSDMGITRVVPARELGLKEIRDIIARTGMEIECFIHGAMCYSYSGKCLFSSIVGGRSGNRGRCAGPCRLPYNDKYILSLRDISTLEIIPELIDAGICSFKIEGRMKSREYVAGVTGIYRKYIDRYLSLEESGEENKYRVDEEDLKELDDLYTRSGHCNGYYHMYNGKEMVTVSRPSYDTPEDKKMNDMYEKYAGQDIKTGCRGYFRAVAGEEISFKLICDEHKVICYGKAPEKALKQPTDRETVGKQLNRLGDTAFKYDELEIDIGEEVFLPVSVINSIRREAFERLKEAILLDFRRDDPIPCNIPGGSKPEHINVNKKIHIRLDRAELIDTVLKSGIADMVSVDINEYILNDHGRQVIDTEALKQDSEKIRDKGCMFFTVLPAVIRNRYFDRIQGLDGILNDSVSDGVIIDNYEGLDYLKKSGYGGTVLADMHMYAANDASVCMLYEMGADILTYPVELNGGELRELSMPRGEFILYGRVPMMISAQCVQKTTDKCIKDNGISTIRDRYGNLFPAVRNCNECFNTILNCIPLAISPEEVPNSLDPYSYRIHFTVEKAQEAEEVIKMYRDLFEGRMTKIKDLKRTLGHLKRGVE